MGEHSLQWLDLAHDARALWIVWMTLLFVGLVFYALRPRNRQHFEDCSRIPFRAESEDQSHE